MSSSAPAAEGAFRENPGFLVRTYRGRDRIFPILQGGLRETFHAIAEVSRGQYPIPFAWIGQCNLVIGEPEGFGLEDVVELATHIEGVPYPVTYDTAPDSLLGDFFIAPGGAIRKLVAGDQLARDWSDDAGVTGSLFRLLEILKMEVCLARSTDITWRWRPEGAVRSRYLFLGTAEMML